MKSKPPKLADLAAAISKHLERFENDPVINATPPAVNGNMRLPPYFRASANYPGGSYVQVMYISFQGWQMLKRDEAIRYLAWLDKGNVGRHYEALRGDP